MVFEQVKTRDLEFEQRQRTRQVAKALDIPLPLLASPLLGLESTVFVVVAED
jgi:hypothetical protein